MAATATAIDVVMRLTGPVLGQQAGQLNRGHE